MTHFLRLEHAALAVALLTGFHLAGGNWWLFAALILVPDLSMAGYLAGPKLGAWAYNAVHSWVAPVALWLLALLMGSRIHGPDRPDPGSPHRARPRARIRAEARDRLSRHASGPHPRRRERRAVEFGLSFGYDAQIRSFSSVCPWPETRQSKGVRIST